MYTFELAYGDKLHNIELISPYIFKTEWSDTLASFRHLMSRENLKWINVFIEGELVDVLIGYELVSSRKEGNLVFFEMEQKRRESEWL